jgi:hypothetical protein
MNEELRRLQAAAPGGGDGKAQRPPNSPPRPTARSLLPPSTYRSGGIHHRACAIRPRHLRRGLGNRHGSPAGSLRGSARRICTHYNAEKRDPTRWRAKAGPRAATGGRPHMVLAAEACAAAVRTAAHITCGVQGRTEHASEYMVWGIAKRRFPSPPNPLSLKERGGTGRIKKRPTSFRTWVLSAPKPCGGGARRRGGEEATSQTQASLAALRCQQACFRLHQCNPRSGGIRPSRTNRRPHHFPRLRGTKGGCGGVASTGSAPAGEPSGCPRGEREGQRPADR